MTDVQGLSIGDTYAMHSTILRAVVGSNVHGMATASSDRDEMGVYVERPEQVLGTEPAKGTYVRRDKPQGVRSEPGDTDLTLHSLRKYMGLALAGNPTILLMLYVPEESLLVRTPLGRQLQALAPAIVSREAGKRFLGYLDAQAARMDGVGPHQSRKPKRPELEAAHGYDTKFASHALRLGLQGIELLTTGRLTLPMPEDARRVCMQVKTGQVDEVHARAQIAAVRARLAELLHDTPADDLAVPFLPDYERVNAWMVRAHREHWGWA